MLRIDCSSHGTITLVEASGSLDGSGAEQLASFLRSEFETHRKLVVLDLQHLDFVGKDGLWELMTALKRARRADGDLRLAQPTERTREVLAMSGLDEIFRIYETQAEAVASF